MINRNVKRLISFLVFPFQNSKWIKFFSEYLPYGDDAEMLYFSIYGERCAVYSMDEKFLNKSLLDDFKKRYEVKYLACFKNSACQSDVSIADHQQMQFLIMLKQKLFVEYDSMRSYRIYYCHKYQDGDLQDVLNIFRKHQKIDWPKSLRYIHLN